MKYFLVILLLFPLGLFAQSKTQPARDKGEIFKHTPTKPYEDLSKSGKVVVVKGMYGLRFEDKELPQSTKDKVQAFFEQRHKGYTELKKYSLKVENRQGVWWIEGKRVGN